MGFEIIWGRIYGIFLSKIELILSRFSAFFGRNTQLNEITAVVITCGESTYEDCISSVENQTVTVNIKTVRDVHPLSASLDAALDICDTKWLLMVDADTILKPYCVEVMERHLKPGVGMVVAKLFDKIYGVIGFLRLIDADTLKKHRFRHPDDSPYPDRSARDFLLQKGTKRIVLNSVVGMHNPYATHFEAFRRFYGTYRKRGVNEQHMGTHINYILKYACRKRAWKEVYYMMAGLVCAAITDSEKSRDYISDSQMKQLFEAIVANDKNHNVVDTTKND